MTEDPIPFPRTPPTFLRQKAEPAAQWAQAMEKIKKRMGWIRDQASEVSKMSPVDMERWDALNHEFVGLATLSELFSMAVEKNPPDASRVLSELLSTCMQHHRNEARARDILRRDGIPVMERYQHDDGTMRTRWVDRTSAGAPAPLRPDEQAVLDTSPQLLPKLRPLQKELLLKAATKAQENGLGSMAGESPLPDPRISRRAMMLMTGAATLTGGGLGAAGGGLVGQIDRWITNSPASKIRWSDHAAEIGLVVGAAIGHEAGTARAEAMKTNIQDPALEQIGALIGELVAQHMALNRGKE